MSKSFHSIACPHCSSKATIRSSRSVTPLVRVNNMICTEPRCGHTFVAQVAILHTLSPSACPNPRINLPLRPQPLRVMPANDDMPDQAIPARA